MNMRPLFVWALCFAFGVYLSLWVYMPLWLFGVAAGLAVVLTMLLWKKYRDISIWMIGLLLLAMGMIRGGSVIYPLYEYTPVKGNVRMAGVLREQPVKRNGGYSAIVTDVSIDGLPVNQDFRISGQGVYGRAGDRLLCDAAVNFPYEDMRLSMLADNIGYYATVTNAQVEQLPATVRYIPARIAGSVKDAIIEMYGEQAPLITGMLLGDKSEMDESTLEAFKSIGTSHILAVSGLHMGFMAAMATLLARKLRPKLRFVVITAALWLYCLMVGTPTSAVRACLMSTCALAADALGRRNDMLSSMSAAALIILLINPAQLFSYGFQMSFAAVYGIAMFEQCFAKAFKKLLPDFLGSSLSVSLSAQLGITPVLIKLYGSLQPLAVLSNLLIVPLAALVTVGALVSAALHMLWPVAAMPAAWVVHGIARLMRLTAERLSTIPFATVEVGYISNMACVALLFLLFFISPYYLPKGIKRIPAVLTAAMVFGIALFV